MTYVAFTLCYQLNFFTLIKGSLHVIVAIVKVFLTNFLRPVENW